METRTYFYTPTHQDGVCLRYRLKVCAEKFSFFQKKSALNKMNKRLYEEWGSRKGAEYTYTKTY